MEFVWTVIYRKGHDIMRKEEDIGSLRIIWDIDVEEWVALRWMTLVQWYPARFIPSQPLDVSHLTYVYGNLKKKC